MKHAKYNIGAKYSIGDAVTPTEEILSKFCLDNLRGRWGLISKVDATFEGWPQYWVFFPEEPYPREGDATYSIEELSWIFFETELNPWEG